MNHLLSVTDLTDHMIESLLFWADCIKNQGPRAINPLPDSIMASFFAEPSTRTRLSFESAMHKLGGNVITAADASISSSLSKGESLKDTFKTLSKYANVIVVRHKDNEWPLEARKWASVPVINAGSGSGEHPTQALLDLFTIQQHFGKVHGLSVLFCGDLKYGRTVHSLISLLTRYNCKIYLCPAETLRCNPLFGNYGELLEKLVQTPGILVDHAAVPGILPDMDVVYMTRVQQERIPYKNDISEFVMTKEKAEMMRKDGMIMHPLPRNSEISEEVDDDPRAYYFKQVENGLYVRMSILQHILKIQP